MFGRLAGIVVRTFAPRTNGEDVPQETTEVGTGGLDNGLATTVVVSLDDIDG